MSFIVRQVSKAFRGWWLRVTCFQNKVLSYWVLQNCLILHTPLGIITEDSPYDPIPTVFPIENCLDLPYWSGPSFLFFGGRFQTRTCGGVTMPQARNCTYPVTRYGRICTSLVSSSPRLSTTCFHGPILACLFPPPRTRGFLQEPSDEERSDLQLENLLECKFISSPYCRELVALWI